MSWISIFNFLLFFALCVYRALIYSMENFDFQVLQTTMIVSLKRENGNIGMATSIFYETKICFHFPFAPGTHTIIQFISISWREWKNNHEAEEEEAVLTLSTNDKIVNVIRDNQCQQRNSIISVCANIFSSSLRFCVFLLHSESYSVCFGLCIFLTQAIYTRTENENGSFSRFS